jgi:hypothetical protein
MAPGPGSATQEGALPDHLDALYAEYEVCEGLGARSLELRESELVANRLEHRDALEACRQHELLREHGSPEAEEIAASRLLSWREEVGEGEKRWRALLAERPRELSELVLALHDEREELLEAYRCALLKAISAHHKLELGDLRAPRLASFVDRIFTLVDQEPYGERNGVARGPAIGDGGRSALPEPADACLPGHTPQAQGGAS